MNRFGGRGSGSASSVGRLQAAGFHGGGTANFQRGFTSHFIVQNFGCAILNDIIVAINFIQYNRFLFMTRNFNSN